MDSSLVRGGAALDAPVEPTSARPVKLHAYDRAILASMIERARNSYYGDECYFGFSGLMADTGLDRPEVRRRCQAMRRKGLTAYSAGLWNDGPAGAGYRCTDAGRQAICPTITEQPLVSASGCGSASKT